MSDPRAKGLTLRPGEPGDASALIQLIRATIPAHSWSDQDIEEELSRPESVVLVAERDEQPCGYAVARKMVDQSEILLIGVDVAHRRCGVGRALVEALEQRLGQGGALWLEVRADDGQAQAFYGAMGFREVGRRPGYYGDTDAVLMSSG